MQTENREDLIRRWAESFSLEPTQAIERWARSPYPNRRLSADCPQLIRFAKQDLPLKDWSHVTTCSRCSGIAARNIPWVKRWFWNARLAVHSVSFQHKPCWLTLVALLLVVGLLLCDRAMFPVNPHVETSTVHSPQPPAASIAQTSLERTAAAKHRAILEHLPASPAEAQSASFLLCSQGMATTVDMKMIAGVLRFRYTPRSLNDCPIRDPLEPLRSLQPTIINSRHTSDSGEPDLVKPASNRSARRAKPRQAQRTHPGSSSKSRNRGHG